MKKISSFLITGCSNDNPSSSPSDEIMIKKGWQQEYINGSLTGN